MPLFLERGYEIYKQTKIDIATVAGSTNINSTVYLHNAGTSIIYIDVYTGVDSTKWELAAGEKLGPLSIQTLHYVGASTSTLKILHLRGC